MNKMKQAILTVYCALAAAGYRVRGEGTFSPQDIHSKNKEVWERYLAAMESVQNAILCNSLQLCEFRTYMRNLEDAEKLVDLAVQTIPNAERGILLEEYSHGTITFERRVYFPNVTAEESPSLVQRLITAGCELQRDPLDLYSDLTKPRWERALIID